MSRSEIDVLGIGNAIVDVIAQHDDSFLEQNSLIKGSMQLVDEQGALSLYGKIGPGIEISGGSAANTIVGVTSFGASTRYIGKVANDQIGDVFAHDIKAANVAYNTQPLLNGPQTARCIVIVSPDGQRTMTTFLGASALLGPDDIVEQDIAAAKTIYLEGYLWDQPAAKEAFRKAAEIAKSNNRKVALTLSDAFCVERHRDSFLSLIRNGVDILFANEAELLSLYQTDSFDEAIRAISSDCALAAVTRSEKGSVIAHDGEKLAVPAMVVDKVVDTTGAGDLYAAGFLFGLSRGLASAECARLGHIAAGEIITHIGARSLVSLKTLI